MPVTVAGLFSVEEMFMRMDSTAKKRAKNKLVEKAYQLRDLARKMAPRDEGNLESAIQVRGDETGARDELGRFTRIEVEIYIDFDMEVPQRPGKTVGDYAYFIHEQLEPVGPWRLGEESQAKQAGQSEQVGGGFMTRAAAAIDATLEEAMLDIFDGML
jgi:hypothetical protein